MPMEEVAAAAPAAADSAPAIVTTPTCNHEFGYGFRSAIVTIAEYGFSEYGFRSAIVTTPTCAVGVSGFGFWVSGFGCR